MSQILRVRFKYSKTNFIYINWVIGNFCSNNLKSKQTSLVAYDTCLLSTGGFDNI